MASIGLLSLYVLVPRQFSHVCHSVDMEWCIQKNHVAEIAIDSCRKSHSQVFERLKTLKTSQIFVYQLIKCYKELWKFKDRAWSRHPRRVRTEATIIKIMWERIH